MLSTVSVCCISSGKMDGSRFIELIITFLFYVFLTDQIVAQTNVTEGNSNGTSVFECPMVAIITTQVVDGYTFTIHNITRTLPCKNGKKMPGCCVDRIFCDYNTSNIDLTMYGPRGFRMPCEQKDVCCPQNYILRIPLPNDGNATDDKSSDEDINDIND